MPFKRDIASYDVVIVGAGPAGLSAAVRLKQLANLQRREISVCVLEKGAYAGAHAISGAVIDPCALNALFPDWKAMGAPLQTKVTRERFALLGSKSAWQIPAVLLPPLMRNPDAYVASLGEFCSWLATQAEALGVEIYSGFTATQTLHDTNGALLGVVTGDMGRTADGREGMQFTPGMEIRGHYTLLAEGARGFLSGNIEKRFHLRDNASPQKYGIGIKEIWRIDASQHRPGLIQHTMGWPLAGDTGGGSFLYHYGDRLLAIGVVIHLNYPNPYLSPFQEFQRFKQHPFIRPALEGAVRLGYGARTINEGGLQSMPRLVFPGGALIGCAAGMVNLPRIKGIHNAMESGMLAAEAVCRALAQGRSHDVLTGYPESLRHSSIQRDLSAVRNVKPWVSKLGMLGGSAVGGVEMWLSHAGIRVPWTLRHSGADHESMKNTAEAVPIDYPRPDNKISFDTMASVALSNIAHDHDQPCHVRYKNLDRQMSFNLPRFAGPEQRYCPAGVYELVTENHSPRLQINAQNCLHCKTCEIKDPGQNIIWTLPQGGSGPQYVGM